VRRTYALKSSGSPNGDRPAFRSTLSAQPRREVEQVSKRYHLLVALKKRQGGQTMAEYGVVLAVITVACLGALTVLSGNLADAIGRVASFIT
jgi:Flp pilus assembly pilin Flp